MFMGGGGGGKERSIEIDLIGKLSMNLFKLLINLTVFYISNEQLVTSERLINPLSHTL